MKKFLLAFVLLISTVVNAQRVSQLPAAPTPLSGNELLSISVGGTGTYKTTVQSIADLATVATRTWTDGTRPTSDLTEPTFGYNTQVHRYEYYDGTTWHYFQSPIIPTLATPGPLTAYGGNAVANLDFPLVTGATTYTVQASSNNFSAIHGTASGSAPPFTVTGLTNGVAYKLRVKASAAGYYTSAWATTTGTVTPSAVAASFAYLVEGNSMEANEVGTAIGGGSTPSPGFYRPSTWQLQALANIGKMPGANITTYTNEAAAGDDIGPSGMLHPTELARVRAAFVPGVRNICYLPVPVNNMQEGQTANQAWVLTKQLHDSIRSYGYETVAATLTASQALGGSSAAVWTQIDSFNKLVRVGYNSYLGAIACVDREAIPPLRGFTAPLNTIWFRGDLIHPSENMARAEGLLLTKTFNTSIVPSSPALVTLGLIDSTNALTSASYHDGNSSKFTYTGDWYAPGAFPPSQTGAGSSWRNGDVTFIQIPSSSTTAGVVSWTTTTTGQIDEGPDVYFVCSANTKAMLSIDGQTAIDLTQTWGYNPNPPATKYPIRVLGAAGAHTFQLTLSSRNGTTAPDYYFDGIDEFHR